jgi:hypothetical protein
MTDPITSPPTLIGFIAWSRAVMRIPTSALTDDDLGYAYAFQIALDLIPLDLNVASSDIYTLTVYNWAGSQLLQFQQDYPGQDWFAKARSGYGINSFVAGVINSAADASTSESLTIGKGLQNLSLVDLQRLKDPYGRQALAWMQTIGTLWGLT